MAKDSPVAVKTKVLTIAGYFKRQAHCLGDEKIE